VSIEDTDVSFRCVFAVPFGDKAGTIKLDGSISERALHWAENGNWERKEEEENYFCNVVTVICRTNNRELFSAFIMRLIIMKSAIAIFV
jgi:hypothetical protein